jgi:hypothetical protein
MSSIDILGEKLNRVNRGMSIDKNEALRFGIVEGEPDFSKDVDLLAKHSIDFEQTPKWKSDAELGIDLGRYGWVAIKAAERALVAEVAVGATALGIIGPLMLAWGIVLTGYAFMEGIQEVIQEAKNISVRDVPYHLLDPGQLDLRDSASLAGAKEKYYLLDKEETEDFEKRRQALNEEMNSVHERISSLKEVRENRMGELAERGMVGSGTHLSEHQSALTERR